MSDDKTPAPEEQKEEQAPETTPEEPTAAEETPAETAEPTEAPAEETKEEAPAEEKTEEAPEAVEKTEEPKSSEPAFKAKLEDFDDLKTGQTVRVHERIKDISPKGEERERIQVFEGLILGFGGSGITRTITVRKVNKGFGVEKIYPINSPVVAKIELVKTAKVRQAKLGYLKNLKKRFKRKLKETHIKKDKKK